jgi:multiple sugar transport system substrate-binding protein
MRKASWVTFVGVLFAAACGDGEPEAGVEITFLRHANAQYRMADEAFFAEYMAAHPEVTITGTTVDFSSVLAMLVGDLARDQFTFDLVLIPPSLVCSFAKNLTDVPPEVVTLSEAQNTFFAAPLTGSICGGVLKGLPVEYNLEYGGVIVNLDKYQAKFPGKTPAWSDWATFITEAAMLTEYDEMGLPRANGLDIDPQWAEPVRHIFLSQILQRGGTYLTAAGDYDFDTQQARDALDDMVSWFNVKKVMFPALVPPENTYVTTRLARGATGYGWNDPARPLSVIGYVGTFGLPGTVSQLPAGANTRYDFFVLPPMHGAEHKFVQNSGWAFAVPRTSKNPKVAWDIAKSLALSPEAMRRWSSVTKALPALKVNGTPEAAAGDPMLAKVQPLLDKGQWLGYVPAGAIEEVAAGMVRNFFDAVAGRKSTQQALMDMQATANSAIGRNR